jgi:hypothetical protein
MAAFVAKCRTVKGVVGRSDWAVLGGLGRVAVGDMARVRV